MSKSTQHHPQAPRHEVDGIVENRVTPPPVYFTLLFYGLILWGVAFSAYYLLSGWSSSAEYAANKAAHEAQVAAAAPAPAAAAAAAAAPAADPAALAAAGKELFASNCASCHGAEGKGGIGPDLTAANYKFGNNHDAVLSSIRDGRPGGMPAYGNQLSSAQIEALAAFCLSLQ
jgi:cytochrome c oxidase cbb3-type subunit 3